MSNRILTKEEIYLRLIEEEYNNQLSKSLASKNQLESNINKFKDDFKFKVKQIILEENRQSIDFEINIITTVELNIGLNSGYDGTAIYNIKKKQSRRNIYNFTRKSRYKRLGI